MMATNDQSAEQQLKDQLEQVCLDYQKLISTSREMPSTDNRDVNPNAEADIEEDIEEIASVSENLDSLASALDLIEERADRIREQLLDLLSSNREIRESLREENARQEDEPKEQEENDKDNATDEANPNGDSQ